MRDYDSEEDDGAGWRYADVDLKPMMSVVCVLIPMILLAFSFYEIKVQPVAAPKVGFSTGGKGGSGSDAPEENKVPLNLTVILTSKGIQVKQTAEVAAGDADVKFEKKMFEADDGTKYEDYDYPAVYSKLMEIKKKHPTEIAVNLGAESDIAWSFVARLVDANRAQLEKDKYTTMSDYAKAKEALDEQGKPKLLFPQVVFVVAD